jgi:hypothetical protein
LILTCYCRIVQSSFWQYSGKEWTNVNCSANYSTVQNIHDIEKCWLHAQNTELFLQITERLEVCVSLLLQWTFELRPAWHTNNLGYDQILSYDPHAGQDHLSYDPHGVCKLQCEPRYACLWT